MSRGVSSIYNRAHGPAPTGAEAKARNHDACAEAWHKHRLAEMEHKMLRSNTKKDTKKQPAECLQHRNGPNRNGSYGDHVMAMKPLPSPEVLRQLLRYEPETGKLFWKERPEHFFQQGKHGRASIAKMWNIKFAGKPAFTALNAYGYFVGRVFNRSFLSHRVAFAIHHGRWPIGEIDHIDHDTQNNRLANLREANRSENTSNRRILNPSGSGFRGVYQRGDRFKASIEINGEQVHLGMFDSAKDAAFAYDRAATEMHGEFAVTNLENRGQ